MKENKLDILQEKDTINKDVKTAMKQRYNLKGREEVGEEEDNGTDKQPRLSFYYNSSAVRQNTNREKVLEEIDKVEQLITLNLQKINENLLRSNAIIGNKLIPTIEEFNKSSIKLFHNTSHIKEFYENAANVNILTKKDLEPAQNDDERANRSSSFHDVQVAGNNIQSTSFELMSDGQHYQISSGKPEQNEMNMSSEFSDLKDIKERYKQNIASNTEEVTASTEINRRIATPIFGEQGNDSFNVAPEDESTGRQVKHSMKDKILSTEILPDSTGLEDLSQREEEEEEEEEGNEEHINENELEATSTSKYVKDMMSGYESPPWEEPPKLQSEKFIGVSKVSTKRHSSVHSDDYDEENPFDDRPRKKQAGGRLHEQNEKVNDENDEEEEEEEDISIRFPTSPKYGGGGKLLRSEEGRQIALDYARSEMMREHPILSLETRQPSPHQHPHPHPHPHPQPRTTPLARANDVSHSSSFEELPELLSERLAKRPL